MLVIAAAAVAVLALMLGAFALGLWTMSKVSEAYKVRQAQSVKRFYEEQARRWTMTREKASEAMRSAKAKFDVPDERHQKPMSPEVEDALGIEKNLEGRDR